MGGSAYDLSHPAVQALLTSPASELATHRGELQAAARQVGLSLDDIASVLAARPDIPRPLLTEERETLLALLNYADFEGRDALLLQVDSARVTGFCACPCATMHLSVDPAIPSAGQTYRPIPNKADVVDDAGEPIGGVIVFADDGYLSSLEIYYYEEPISPFPPLERMQLSRRHP